MDKANHEAADLLLEIGLSNVAREMGVTRQAVYKWKRHGIPPDRADDMRLAFPGLGARKLRNAIGRGRFAE